MLFDLWTWYGCLSAGIFAGSAFAFVVMTHWYTLMDRNGWDGTTAPDWLFALHIAVALLGAWILGQSTYGFCRRVVARQNAKKLERSIRQPPTREFREGVEHARAATKLNTEAAGITLPALSPLPSAPSLSQRSIRPAIIRVPGLLFCLGIPFAVSLAARAWGGAAVLGAALAIAVLLRCERGGGR